MPNIGYKTIWFPFVGGRNGGWVYIILFEKNKNYETYNRSERAQDGQSFLQVMEHFVKKLVIDFCNSDETLVKCQINTRETLVKHW